MFSPVEVERFARDGFHIAQGLVPRTDCERMLAVAREQLSAARAPIEYEADVQYPGSPESREAPGGRTIRRLLSAYSRHPLFGHWAVAPTIAMRLEQLLGSPAVLAQAHHNCVMTKDPRYGSSTSWHRDIRYWSFERPELVSVWIALGSERRDNGALRILPGTHRMTFYAEQLDPMQFLRTDFEGNSALLATEVSVELDPGDILFFHSRLFHAAGQNRTDETKFSLVYTYRTADNPPLPGTRSSSLPEVPLAAGTGTGIPDPARS